MLVPDLFEDLSILHQNTMPVHSYFIPRSRQGAAHSARITGKDTIQRVRTLREDSDRIQMLSGCPWHFRYFPSIHDIHELFFRTDFIPDGLWAQEKVPFCWQMRGYDENQYTNMESFARGILDMMMKDMAEKRDKENK